MPPRYVRNHRTRCDRLSNDPSLRLVVPPSAANHARYFPASLNDLRVVTINQSISSCTFLLTGRMSSDSEGR